MLKSFIFTLLFYFFVFFICKNNFYLPGRLGVDKHKYYRKHKMSGIEHPQTQYQHVMINITKT